MPGQPPSARQRSGEMATKWTIERVDMAEADVTVRYPSGKVDVIKGGTYTEWHVIKWEEGNDIGQVSAMCHSEEGALGIKTALERFWE